MLLYIPKLLLCSHLTTAEQTDEVRNTGIMGRSDRDVVRFECATVVCTGPASLGMYAGFLGDDGGLCLSPNRQNNVCERDVDDVDGVCVSGVDFGVKRGQLITIIGAKDSGKAGIIETLTGVSEVRV